MSRRWPLLVLSSILLIATHTRAQQEPLAKDSPQLTRTGARKTFVVKAIERVKGAVVNIHSERNVMQNMSDLFPVPASPNKVNGMGTGIVIDPRGYIVTNQHVVEDVTALRIHLSDGKKQNAVVIARHPERDLAIIKIDPPYPLAVMPIGTSSDLMVGETVIAIGNAYGYDHTASLGIVSAIKRDVTLNKDMSYKDLIQTDASINPGNSGGPLVNIHGELVGVNVAIRAGAQGIGFAIPVDHMVSSVSDMLKARRRGAADDGLTYRDQPVPGSDGPIRQVIVDSVEPSSPAEKAGLRKGDLLTTIGELKILSGIDVERGLLDCKASDVLTIKVRRKEQEHQLKLALLPAKRRFPLPSTEANVIWQKLGIELEPVSREIVTRVNKQLHGGVKVTKIDDTGLAHKGGIRLGDILVGLHKWETISQDNVQYVLNHPDSSLLTTIPFFIVRDGQLRSGQLPVPLSPVVEDPLSAKSAQPNASVSVVPSPRPWSESKREISP
jgi:serine protease Do